MRTIIAGPVVVVVVEVLFLMEAKVKREGCSSNVLKDTP
jgi:hypothetical protein